MSTPSNSASGNIRPASITIMSSPQRTAMQFIPNSPRPPRGIICNFPVGIWVTYDASTACVAYRTERRLLRAVTDGNLRLSEVGLRQWLITDPSHGFEDGLRRR